MLPYVVILIVVVLIRSFLITPIMVRGESMQPTYNGGEVMLLSKISKKYERFDVVVVDIEKERIIKRIIALPGETIACENGIKFFLRLLPDSCSLVTRNLFFDFSFRTFI